MNEGSHRLFIAQDRGNALKRMYKYVKADPTKNFSVRVKNLITQAGWGYDKYHQDIPNGMYVLIFSNPEVNRDYTMELEVTENTEEEIFVIFSWRESIQFMEIKKVTKEEFDTYTEKKRLGYPAKYQGY